MVGFRGGRKRESATLAAADHSLLIAWSRAAKPGHVMGMVLTESWDEHVSGI